MSHARTLAGACVHNGIFFSFVSISNRKLASAIKDASTVTLLVLSVFFTGSAFFGGWLTEEAAVEADALEAVAFDAFWGGAGVPERLGSVLTVRSLPWVSISAAGNSANLVSRAVGRRDFARAKSESTAGDEAVVSVQLYCMNEQI
jgi:hypothetical protein